ncbi:MAG: LysR family transcriptional regulator [Hyphomicrobiales bacterium]|nr:LysR family transcriptional regulator [Hyphomicrobiales bacterium]MBV9590623.1 LysR family transcriptional regulator [Hyphomicrobiales bacterium]MBV9975113.1 LysR family transcriptional regulator [Hyphomicrobiales bacterium]
MDWDRLRIFCAAAEVGSFTHAGDMLELSQSAVSRQIAALEEEVGVPLFHRHARGLILTEPGETLFRTALEMKLKIETARARLVDTREKPNGQLRITTTIGLGTYWLTPRLGEFLDNFPDIRVELLLIDEELDLAMRQADVAIRLRLPVQSDLVQRRLFTVHFHAYASAEYVKRHGMPKTPEELDAHRIVAYGGSAANYLLETSVLPTLGRDPRQPRSVALTVSNVSSVKRAVESGFGVGILPDYLVVQNSNLVRVLTESEMPSLDTYFVYPEELRNVARVQVFRDFMIQKAQRWSH